MMLTFLNGVVLSFFLLALHLRLPRRGETVAAAAAPTPPSTPLSATTATTTTVPPSPPTLRYSLSGFSSGGSMAVVHLFAFSSEIEGVGLVGASPYGCQILPDCADTCSGWQSNSSSENTSIPWADYLDACRDYAGARAQQGLIDPLTTLSGVPAYLFSGTADSTVFPSVMRAVRTQLQQQFRLNVSAEYSLAAQHAWIAGPESCVLPNHPDPDATRCCGTKGKVNCPLRPHAGGVLHAGGCCGACGDPSWTPPVNRCGNYSLNARMFQWFYPGRRLLAEGMEAPRASAANLLPVNQSRYFPERVNGTAAGLDDVAFVYAPARCWRSRRRTLSPCPVHVHYHCCGCTYKTLSTSYMLESGLADHAEARGVVVVFPQTTVKGPSGLGCWDWSGAVDAAFDTKRGISLRTVRAMVADLPQILGNADV